MKRIILILLVSLGLQAQAQITTCDSITYWTDQGQGLFVGLDTTSITYNPDSIEVLWQVCNANMCYSGVGMNPFFGQITTADTIKVCYDAYLYTTNTMEICTRCDSLVFNMNTYQWEILQRVAQPTAIKEVQFNTHNIGKAYDLLGRELNSIPKGKMYIRNNRLYINNFLTY